MTLFDDVKVALRVSAASTMTDSEIAVLIGAATEDLARVGVDPAYIEPQDGATPPLVVHAVMSYVKAHYGYDNDEAARFDASYRLLAANLAHSHPKETED